MWKWNGYYRRVERNTGQLTREIVATLINVNRGKNSSPARPGKLYPLNIDNVTDEVARGFDLEAANKIADSLKGKNVFKN
jgi:hypothetical protein